MIVTPVLDETSRQRASESERVSESVKKNATCQELYLREQSTGI